MIFFDQLLEMGFFRAVAGHNQFKIQPVLGQETAGFQEKGKTLLDHQPAQGQNFIGRCDLRPGDLIDF